MRILRLLNLAALAFTLVYFVSRTSAATYYVATTGDDTTGDGSAGNPWATISHADASGLLPGDTVIVQAGTYPQADAGGTILQTSAGTPESPITYQADGKVVIDQAAFPGANYGIQVLVSGITLTGFEITHAAHAIFINGVGNCVVSNCVMHDSQPVVDSTGVFFNAAWDSTVEKSVMYNINSGVDQPWGPLGAAVRTSIATNIYVLNNTFVNTWLGVFVMNQAVPVWKPLTTFNNIAAGCKGWAFVNPWSTDPSWCTNGYNLIYENTISYGNYPPGNNPGADVPQPTDIGPVDPQFVFAATGDFHLLSGSPAIDEGIDVGLPYEGSAPDIGAFEGAYAPSTNGTVSGKVTANLAGSPPVAGAVVQTLDGTISTTTDADGNYSLILPAGSITLMASGRGLATQTNDTSLPNGGAVVLNFSLNQTYVPVTYHVDNASGNDSNPGTQAQPWKTIDNGDRLDVLKPGDTVMVQAGTYSQANSNGVSLTHSYGYAFSPITYQAQGNVVIDQSSYNGTSYGFNVAVAGITVNGFEITGAQHGVYLSPESSSCTVSSCVIHDGNAVGQDAEGIFVDKSPNHTLKRNVIYNITDPNDFFWTPLGCGIRVSNGNNLKVENNTIDNAYVGVFWYGARLDQSGIDHGPWGTMTALNNIIVNCLGYAFASPQSQDPSLVTAGYNLVFGNGFDYEYVPGGNEAPLPSDVQGQDPMFVDGAAHNYQLQSGSPAIDAGTGVGLAYNGLGPDVGAFESSFANTAQTYYVDATTGNDSNPGTSAQPWRTIDNGDVTGVLKPGDTVMVNAGTYAQASAGGVQLINRSGTPIAPITYQAQGAVLIDQSSFGVGSYGFQVEVAGVVVDGFEIMGAQHGVYVAPRCDSCTVNACVIHDANSGGTAEGISVNQNNNVMLTRNVIYNIHSDGEAPWGPVGCGIRVQGGNNITAFNNTIDNAYLGLFYFGGAGPGAGPYGTITTKNNIVVNCTGWGFVNPWNTTPQLFTHGYNLTYNDVNAYGNYPGGNQGPLAHDIDGQDPLFVDAASHDYHLQAGSPAINTGTDVGLPFAGGVPDMGAYDAIDTAAPKVLYALRDSVQQTMVTVVFANLLDPATATDANNYTLNNANSVSAASLNADGKTVVLTTSPLANNTINNILTIDNVQNIDGVNIAPSTQVSISVPSDTVRAEYAQGGADLVVLEAEHYNLNTPAGSSYWVFTTSPSTLLPTDADTNYSGDGAMMALPNAGLNLGTPALGTMPAGSPSLDYTVQFTNTGTFYVWVRGIGDSDPGPSANDSVFIGLDGELTTRLTGFPQGQGYAWGNSPVGDSGPIVVNTTGTHVINVWMREDGFVADKILLTSDSGAVPSGLGPMESPALTVTALTIVKSGPNILTVTWPGGGALQSSTNVAGTYIDIPGATSPHDIVPNAGQTYYRVRQ